jgi:UDP-3-O-[3-hydroxymyristoyl] glucosamine N-acyltransferase
LEKCLIASQTGIAGCVIIEDEVTIWGQVGTTSGITIEQRQLLWSNWSYKISRGVEILFWNPIEESREKLKNN